MNDRLLYEKEFVKRFDFLMKLAPEERKHLLKATNFYNVEAGRLLVSEKGSCMGIAFLLAGELKNYKVSESGREISLYMSGPGEVCVMSVACLLGEGRNISPVSVVATQDSTVAVVPCDVFRYHYMDSPDFQQFIFKNTLFKFYDLIGLVERLTFKSVTERLWEHMLAATEKGKKPLYTTHEQLAAKLGTSREVVTRRLHEIENAGLIEIKRGKLMVLNADADYKTLLNIK